MEFIAWLNGRVGAFVWGPVMLAFIVGTGIYLSVRCGFPQAVRFRYAWKHTVGSLFKKGGAAAGDGKNVSPFAAMSTALASTIGVGNVAGVAGAICMGGPGALFWMWASAFFGMCTKYCEIVLALRYRRTAADGTYYGGPMYYIQKGFKNKKLGRALSGLFAMLAGVACFGMGNATQSAELSTALGGLLGLEDRGAVLVMSLVLALTVGFVILGGIHSIASITSVLVPFMAGFFILGCLAIIMLNLTRVPACLAEIMRGAFSLRSAGGGVFGYGIFLAMQKGIARGVFSNEAGLGSAPMAHAASSTKEPVLQGLWGIFEVFIDTIVVCTLTGICILLAGLYKDGLTGGALSAASFELLLPGFGGYIVRLGIVLFAAATILGWEYYGEVCWGYLAGNSRAVLFSYRIAYALVTFLAAYTAGSSAAGLSLIWDVADTLNGLMALPNLLALLVLSPVARQLTKDYFSRSGRL